MTNLSKDFARETMQTQLIKRKCNRYVPAHVKRFYRIDVCEIVSVLLAEWLDV
jgi:hypothetical protein